jgi:hypothetical protein
LVQRFWSMTSAPNKKLAASVRMYGHQKTLKSKANIS